MTRMLCSTVHDSLSGSMPGSSARRRNGRPRSCPPPISGGVQRRPGGEKAETDPPNRKDQAAAGIYKRQRTWRVTSCPPVSGRTPKGKMKLHDTRPRSLRPICAQSTPKSRPPASRSARKIHPRRETLSERLVGCLAGYLVYPFRPSVGTQARSRAVFCLVNPPGAAAPPIFPPGAGEGSSPPAPPGRSTVRG